MRLLVSWVRDFVDVTASPAEIAEALGVRGFEVASLEDCGTNDGIIDFEVTANRPDCLSVIGFAREIATLYDLPLRVPTFDAPLDVAIAPVPTGESERVKITLEASDLCPRYAAAVADVVPTATPAWMADRLQAAGIRPISPLVDVTNYVLMELGHPMHAFDLASLAGRELQIRRARSRESITTLDGIHRVLEPDMLVIADSARPQAVAGVMGGRASEVSSASRTVAFESAYFSPVSVRRTSKRLGVKTEASSRFERGVDVNAPVVALQRAIALMHRIGAGRVVGSIVDRYPIPQGPKTIVLRRARMARLLGLEVPDAEAERILRRLDLQVSPIDEGWKVVVPTFRVDLAREVDLIEEVGRHYGFDRLDPTFPRVAVAAAAPDPRVSRDQLVRRVLTAAGLSEAVSFGFIEARAAEAFVPDATEPVVLANPLSAKFEVLRPSLLPGLLDAVAHNRRHGRRDVAVFEVGARFTRSKGETRGVGLVMTGAATPEHWSDRSREIDFFDVKGIVERLCLTLDATVTFEPVSAPNFVAGHTAAVVAGGAHVGVLGLLAPPVVESGGAPRQDPVLAAELDLDSLQGQPRERVRPLPRFPSVVRDLSIVVSDTLPAEFIRGTIRLAGDTAAAPLVDTAFFDRYKGKGVPERSVSLSVRLTFQAPDRTLTDAEVQEAFERIVAALVREHGAIQR